MQADGEAHPGAAHKDLDGDPETAKCSQDQVLYLSPTRRYARSTQATSNAQKECVCVRACTPALLRAAARSSSAHDRLLHVKLSGFDVSIRWRLLREDAS